MKAISSAHRAASATASVVAMLVFASLALAGTPAQPLQVSVTADSPNATAGAANGYTITISNPGPDPAQIDTITDDLPSGFTYTSGSTTGVTQSEPSVSGQRLTWSGPFMVPPRERGTAGTVTLHFNVLTSSTPGTYTNSAGATPAEKVNSSGQSAPVTVVAGGGGGGTGDPGTGTGDPGTGTGDPGTSTGSGGDDAGGSTRDAETPAPGETGGSAEGGGLTSSGTDAGVPPPEEMRVGNAEPVGDGQVFVRVPGSNRFVLLSELRQVPVGSRFDTTTGTLRLTVDNGEAIHTAMFGGGQFVFTQHPVRGRGGRAGAAGSRRLFTDAKLVGGDFSSCRRSAKSAGPGAQAARRRSRRRLFGQSNGRVRTRGRHGAAAVRGTRWDTYDGCDSTTFKVDEGSVTVTDFRLRRRVVVRAGERYRAVARRRR